jgi:hypothetical protein
MRMTLKIAGRKFRLVEGSIHDHEVVIDWQRSELRLCPIQDHMTTAASLFSAIVRIRRKLRGERLQPRPQRRANGELRVTFAGRGKAVPNA